MKQARFLFSVMMLAACSIPLYGQPRIVVEGGTSFDFGVLMRGAVVKRIIAVKNAGTDTLILKRVMTSCGCTGAVASGDHLPPGGTGSVEITFNSQNFTGSVHKVVTIETNVPDSPRTEISFTANIQDEISVVPDRCFFKDAEVGKPSALTLTVKNAGKEKFTLTGSRCALAGIKVKLPAKPLAPGDSIAIPVVFTPAKAIPVLYEALFITTSDPRRPELYFPIYGNVKEASKE